MAFKRVIIRRVGPLSWLLEPRNLMNNPYQPPASNELVSRTPPQRPASVKAAVSIFVSTLLLSVVGIFLSGANENFTAITVFVFVILFSMYLTGAYFVWAGWNWARIIGVIFLVLDTVSRISLGSNFYKNTPVLAALVFLIAALDFIAIILLVNKKTSAWLKDLKAFRSSGF
jgi:hypothetical protein